MPEPITNNPLNTDSDKNSAAFGLKIIKEAYASHIKGYDKESYASKVKRFDENRMLAMGKQDTGHLRDLVKVDGAIAIINLDYSPLPIAVPFLNRLYERYNQRPEKIKVSAIDPFSQDKKRKAKEDERFKMQYKGAIQGLQENSGMPLEDFLDNDSKTEAELEIKYGFTFKTVEENIMQMAMRVVFYDNNWKEINKPRILKDIVECGYAVVHVEVDGNSMIKTPFVKPEDFITSYSEFDDFRDWQYQGQSYFISIAEIRLRFPGKIKEEELWRLSRKSAGNFGNPVMDQAWNPSYNTAIARPYDRVVVNVVDLYYKTLYNLTYEKNTDSFGKEILDKTSKVKDSKDYEKSDPYYVAYKGTWIVDTDYLLEWGLAKKMIKPNANLTEVLSPYVVFMPNNNKGVNTPLVEMMRPSINMMQLLNLQIQRIIAMTAPDGYMIDVSGLSSVQMGEGIGLASPMQLFDIYLQTGNQYYKKIGDDGETPGEPPIRRDPGQYSNKIEQLENQWQREYAKLQQIVGSNNLDAGQITNQAVANSTLNDARQMSENASNFVYGAYLNLYKRAAKLVQLRLWDKFVFGEGTFDGYAQAVGSDNVEYIRLESTDDFEKTNFDTTIEAVVDDSEMNLLDQRINIALQAGTITLADVVMLGMIDNPTYKAMMLVERAKQKEEADAKKAALNSQMNQQQAVAAANATTEGNLKVAQQQHQQKLEQIELENKGRALDEDYKFSGILKAKVVDAILSKPDGKIDQIPDFIWAGLNVTNDSQKQMMLQAIQEQAAQAQQVQMQNVQLQQMQSQNDAQEGQPEQQQEAA